MVRAIDNPPDKTIENGVVVPGRLTRNEMSISEHQAYIMYVLGARPLNRAEAEEAGHPSIEIEAWFLSHMVTDK